MENIELLNKIIIGRVEPHIYAFTTNTIPNYLKIGDTYRPVEERLNEWKSHYPELKKQYEEKAIINEEIFFRDYSVHKFIEEELGKIRLIEENLDNGIYYSNEFFKDTSVEDIDQAIKDIKDKYAENSNKYQYYNSENLLPEIYKYKSTGLWDLRPNQEEVVKKFKQAVKDGRTNLLMYAVMRFGKSFTSLYCAKEINSKLVVVVSAKADVKEEWKKTVESADNFNEIYDFISADDLYRDNKIISNKLKNGRGIVVFLTLQDLQGNEIKTKHEDLFTKEVDLLIIDETHFGARAEKYGEIIRNAKYESEKKEKNADLELNFDEINEDTKALNAKIKLHLSGTPYRILMGSEFEKEDIICFCQFADIIKAKDEWDKENLLIDGEKEWNNPYYGFPQMIRFAFNPSKKAKEKLKEYKSNGYTYAFSSLFKPLSIKKDCNNNYKKFKNEEEILELFEVIDGSKSDENLLGFLNNDKIKEGKMCRHIVCVLPYCASCDALEELLKNNKEKFKNLNQYEIINISGLDSTFRSTDEIKSKIKECESNEKKTITLTVNRMLTGSTVPEWDTMLYFKDTSSPQEYDQAIFRLQNQYIKEYIDNDKDANVDDNIKYNMKPQTLLVDFDPERMFTLQEQKSLINVVNINESGNSKLKSILDNELKISPIITINKNKIVEISPNDIMLAVSNYSKNRGVMDEANDIPVDLTLLNIQEIKNVIEKQSELGSRQGLFTDNTNEENGNDIDIPEDLSINIDDSEVIDNDSTKSSSNEENNINDSTKQFKTYYARILFFAFLTKDKVISLSEIINVMNKENNDRILKNLGISKNIIILIQKNMDPFKLNQLDNKIQNINNLSTDESSTPIERAMFAINKFKKLSESEYITSIETCDNMINQLSNREVIDIINQNGNFLDIASKIGEFTLSIFNKCMANKNVDIDKIRNSVYSIPSSNIAYEFTRKIYEILDLNIDNIATKFNSYDLLKVLDENGNIDYNRINEYLHQNKLFSEIELEDNMFIKERNDKMKFDIVVGNPPYQVSDGGALASAKPIYQHFVNIAKNISSRYVSLIIPTRWYVGGKGLDDFRNNMLCDNHIKELHDCLTPDDIFPNTNIRGGVCYFLRDFTYDNEKELVNVITHENNNIINDCKRPMKINSYDVFIRDSMAKTIIDKINNNSEFNSISDFVSARKPFGLDGNFARTSKYKKNSEGMKNPISCYSKGKTLGFLEKNDILNHNEWINKWKVFIPRANNIGTELNDDNMNSFVGEPNEVCTESYLMVGAELNLDSSSSSNLEKYLKTKFSRYLHGLLKSSQDATSKTFDLVPLQDFTEKSDIDWKVSIKDIDKQLYSKYNLSDEEIKHIESKIKEM